MSGMNGGGMMGSPMPGGNMGWQVPQLSFPGGGASVPGQDDTPSYRQMVPAPGTPSSQDTTYTSTATPMPKQQFPWMGR